MEKPTTVIVYGYDKYSLEQSTQQIGSTSAEADPICSDLFIPHYNVASKKALPNAHRRTRQMTQLFTYLLTHNLLSSCIRRCLVARVCD